MTADHVPNAARQVSEPQKVDRYWPRKIRLAETAVFLLVLNLFVMGGLMWKVETNKPPVIATVAVTQLSRMYSQQFASDPTNSPEMISLKTQIFMATTEKLIGQVAHRKGMIVLARECVLTGDNVDLTSEIAASVDKALKESVVAPVEVSHDALHIAP